MSGIEFKSPEERELFFTFVNEKREELDLSDEQINTNCQSLDLSGEEVVSGESVLKRYFRNNGDNLPKDRVTDKYWRALKKILQVANIDWENYKKAQTAKGIDQTDIYKEQFEEIKAESLDQNTPNFEITDKEDQAFLEEIKYSIIDDLKVENEIVLNALLPVFNAEFQNSALPLSHQLIECFITRCRGSVKDFWGLIDKLDMVFRNLDENTKKSHPNNETKVAAIRGVAERMLSKLLLFTVKDQWVSKQKHRNGNSQEYFLPDLDLNTLKVVHSRLNQYVANGLNKNNAMSGEFAAGSINLPGRIEPFLRNLAIIVDPDNSLGLEFEYNVKNLSVDDRINRSKTLAKRLNNLIAYRKTRGYFGLRHGFFWRISDYALNASDEATANQELINWCKENISELHWIILKSDVAEEILWFDNDKLEAAIVDFYFK